MNTFAKTFQVGDLQVLITKEYEDSDKVRHIIKQRTELEGITPSISMGFEREQDRDDEFTEYGQPQAEKFIESVKELLE